MGGRDSVGRHLVTGEWRELSFLCDFVVGLGRAERAACRMYAIVVGLWILM